MSRASNAVTGRYRRTQRLTATGVWTCPASVFEVEAIIIGGGPGGGGGSPGNYSGGTSASLSPGMGGVGGGSAYARRVRIPVVPGTSYPVIIGAGGIGGTGAPAQTTGNFPYPNGGAGQPGTPTSFAGYRALGGQGSPGGLAPTAQQSSQSPVYAPVAVALMGSPSSNAAMPEPSVSSAGGTPGFTNSSTYNLPGGPAAHRPGFATTNLNVNIGDPNQVAPVTAADIDAYAHVGGAGGCGVGGAAANFQEVRFGGVGGAAGAVGSGALTVTGTTATVDGGTGASATAPGGGGGGGGGGATRNANGAPFAGGRGGDGGAGGAGAVLLAWEE